MFARTAQSPQPPSITASFKPDSLAGPRFLEGLACAAGCPWFAVVPNYSIFAAAVRLNAPGYPWFAVVPNYSIFAAAVRLNAPGPAEPTHRSSPQRVAINSLADVKRAKALKVEESTTVVSRFVELSKTQPSNAWRELLRLVSAKSRSFPSASSPEAIMSHFKSVNGVHRPYLRTTPFRKRVETAGLVLGSDFASKELLHALAHLKTNRAVGIDEMPAEVSVFPKLVNRLLLHRLRVWIHTSAAVKMASVAVGGPARTSSLSPSQLSWTHPSAYFFSSTAFFPERQNSSTAVFAVPCCTFLISPCSIICFPIRRCLSNR